MQERKKYIVVVEDSESIRELLYHSLSQEGYEVTGCENAYLALQALENNEFSDLIITDVNMPGMDGIQLIKTIREKGKNRFTPILVITTENMESKRNEAKKLGATGWIVKPFSKDKIIETVKRLIG